MCFLPTYILFRFASVPTAVDILKEYE